MLPLSTIIVRLIFLCFTCLIASILGQAQPNKPNIQAFSQADVEELYQQCNGVREDTISRICISFLNNHHIRRENIPAFFAFCTTFKNYAFAKGDEIIGRRISIIELHGQLRFDSTRHGTANKDFEDLHEAYIKQNDYPAALECLYELGQFLHAHGDNIKALQVLFYAEKFAAKYGLHQKITYQGILHRIAYILWQLNKPLLSISYFKKALATGNSLQKDSMVAFNALGMNYQQLDSLPLSMQYFTKASKMALADKNDVFNTVVLGSTAVTLLKLGETRKAYKYSQQYKNISVQYLLWNNAVDAFNRLIEIELMQNNKTHAKILLDSLYVVMNKISSDDFVSYKKCKQAAYLYHEKLGRFEPALAAFKEYVHYDSLFQDYANKNKISELELNAGIRLYEEEMLRKDQIRKWQSIITNIGIVILLVALCWVGIYTYQRILLLKKEKTNIEDLNISQADEIEQLKVQLLAQLATIREQNTRSQALPYQNNPALPQVTTEVISTQANTSSPTLGKADTDVSNAQLLDKFNLSQKEQWNDFKDFFSKTYPGFTTTIANKIGAVSPAELRLLMLLKLGLTTKEIAETLLITLDGVKKAKYRLYKKIGVTSAAEMEKFLVAV